jgi:dolichyl-diphosphooligosaccharide--protein glycosyltransferase
VDLTIHGVWWCRGIWSDVLLLLASRGYFGPISARVRGLFVKHTKTGNPLVDSLAEHQAASPQAYFQYLHDVCYIAPIGLIVTALFYFNDSSSFLIVYGVAAYFFSHKMVRLILLTAPIASCSGGIFLGRLFSWMVGALFELVELPLTDTSLQTSTREEEEEEKQEANEDKVVTDKKGKGKKSTATNTFATTAATAKEKKDEIVTKKSHPILPAVLLIRLGLSFYMIKQAIPSFQSFLTTSHEIAKSISHPTIINKARTKNGDVVIVDDYREAYFWLRDHTPEDARIMAWWDYGYQITGIGNRTTLADGNTWNHEHIALLGRILTAPEKEAHRIARHLADYVLIWAGGGGDDVAKSPHLRRIANSVYRGLCREPTCRDFGFYSDHRPTKSMEESLLFKLHSHNLTPDVQVDRNRFREVFNSKYGKVRIYKIQSVSQESKDWVAASRNKFCDAPDSWFCPGQYPPALEKILASKRDFMQLEDFNKGVKDDDDYQRQYFENLLSDKKFSSEEGNDRSRTKRKIPKLSPEEVDMINEEWENNELTTLLWELIAENRVAELREIFIERPQIAHIRSEDGRGPMWWAHENGRTKIIEMLKKLQVSEKRTDADGISPLDVSKVK